MSPNGSHSLKGHTRPVRGGTAFNPSHRDSVRDGPVAEPGDGGLLERGCLTRRVKGQSVRFAYRLTVLTSDNSRRQGRHGTSSASARVRVPPLNVFQPRSLWADTRRSVRICPCGKSELKSFFGLFNDGNRFSVDYGLSDFQSLSIET